MTEQHVLTGGWVTLQPAGPGDRAELERLNLVRHRTPNLGGAAVRSDVPSPFGPPMLIRENRSQACVGVIEAGEMSGYPGVAVVLVMVDTARARPGAALEAFAMFVAHVFRSGARLVHMEVLASNDPVVRILGRLGLREQARLRDQVYSGGRFCDVLVYAFEAEEFARMWGRYERILPGGGRRPAAFGGGRRRR